MRIGINALGLLSKDSGACTYAIDFVFTSVETKLPHEFFIFYSGPERTCGKTCRRPRNVYTRHPNETLGDWSSAAAVSRRHRHE